VGDQPGRPAQGRWTYGFKRAEILSAQANGLTLLLAAWFVYEAIRRLFDPPEVRGLLVFLTAMIVINIAAAWLISKANRTSTSLVRSGYGLVKESGRIFLEGAGCPGGFGP
jgi:cobalt-zinc-cadmium efflux system protein